MSSSPRIRLAGQLIRPHRLVWGGLIGCALLFTSTYVPWSTWISHIQNRLRGPSFRRRRLQLEDGTNNAVELGDEPSRDKDDNIPGGAEKLPEDRGDNISDRTTPRPAEYPLQILHDDPEAIVDIVAVHGLGANPDYAWVWLPKNNPLDRSEYPDKPFNWLEELLPAELAKLAGLRCRVVAFNYNSKWIQDAPQQRLSDISAILLDSLRNNREKAGLASGQSTEQTISRPLIFIGHSFGGNIIEQAIVSASRHRSEYLQIAESTVGVIFLGTPHRGCAAAEWGEMIASLAPPSFVTEPRLLKALHEQSDSLTDRLHDFSRWLFSESVPVVCCYEQLKTDYSSRIRVIGNIIPFKKLVVPDSSACIDGHRKIALQVDHFKINKFYGPEDPSFKHIYPEIERMARNAREMLKRRREPKAIPTDQGATSGELRKCLQKMRVANPLDILSDVRAQKGERVGYTCEWILRREEFSVWAASKDPRLLRLVGSPGIGKTMMSTFLVEVLRVKVERTPGKTFAYFFCDDKNQGRKTPTTILRSLVWQLLLQKNELFEHIQPDFEKHAGDRVFEDLFNNFSALWRIFQCMLRDERAGEVFILVDALDECERSTREVFFHSVGKLFQSSPTARLGNFKFLITHRPGISDIEDELKQVGVSLSMDSSKVNTDLSEYINDRVEKLARTKDYSPSLKEAVRKTLSCQAGGTFLWVSFMFEALRKTPKDEVEQKLDNLPKGLDETYARILNENDSDDKQKRARFLLLSMLAARRPLKKIEIAAGFAIWKDGSVLQRQHLHDYMDICSSCSSLVYLNTKDNDYDTTLTFCHQSVKDFLLREVSGTDKKWYHASGDEANLFVFEMCWTYLSAEEFDRGSLVTRREGECLRSNSHNLQLHFQENSFLEYSSCEWENHAIASYPALLADFQKSKINPTKAPALRDSWLLRTAREGQEAIVKLLLREGANVESKDNDGRTPLSWAAKNRHEAVVQRLLEKGADIESRDNIYGRTPLSWAAENGHEAVVQRLLEKGADIESRDNIYGQTPLSWAAENGHEAVVQRLLEKGADIESRDNIYGQTPLSWAAENGHKAVVQRLLEKGADIESRDKKRLALPARATGNGYKAVV